VRLPKIPAPAADAAAAAGEDGDVRARGDEVARELGDARGNGGGDSEGHKLVELQSRGESSSSSSSSSAATLATAPPTLQGKTGDRYC
jgi:hypothetical protein